jgi:iron complex outermembrane receptor protein
MRIIQTPVLYSYSFSCEDIKQGFLIILNKIFYIIIVLTACGSVYGQTTASLNDSVATDEILVTANRIRTTPLLSPNKVQVIGQNYFAGLNGDKLSDALGFADGTFIRDYGFNSGLKTVTLNLTQTEHTLILYNGVRLNSHQNSQFDIGLLQLDDISRIEISKGGASSLYGSEAIGGVINIITTRNSAYKPFSYEIKSELGSYGFNRFFIKGSNAVNTGKKSAVDFSYSFSNEQAKNNYGYNYFNGFSNVKREREYSDYKQRAVNFDLNFKINKSTELRFFTLYSYKNRGLPGIDIGYISTVSRQIDRDVISSAVFNKKFSNVFSAGSGFSYKYTLMNYYDELTQAAQPVNSFYKINNYTHNSELKYFLSKKHEFDFGYDLSYNTITSNETERGKLFQAALYSAGKVEVLLPLISKFTVYPSVRSDYYSNINKNVLSGKLGINIKPFEKANLSFKSSVANSFKVPTFNELYWIGLGNKNLLPEKSVSFDAGMYFSVNFIADTKIELSYFNINTKNRIVWTPDARGVWRPINIGKVKSEGIDASIKTGIRLFKDFTASLGFNYNYGSSLKKSKDSENDVSYNKQLLYLPQEYAKSSVNLSFEPAGEFVKLISLNVFYTFTGKRFINAENTRFIPYYELIDANINMTFNFFKTETSLKFAVNNFTGEDYEVMYGYPMPLRNFKLQIGIKY